jgi:hypothetical protein
MVMQTLLEPAPARKGRTQPSIDRSGQRDILVSRLRALSLEADAAAAMSVGVALVEEYLREIGEINVADCLSCLTSYTEDGPLL